MRNGYIIRIILPGLISDVPRKCGIGPFWEEGLARCFLDKTIANHPNDPVYLERAHFVDRLIDATHSIPTEITCPYGNQCKWCGRVKEKVIWQEEDNPYLNKPFMRFIDKKHYANQITEPDGTITLCKTQKEENDWMRYMHKKYPFGTDLPEVKFETVILD